MRKVAVLQQQALHINPPAIPFRRKHKKSDEDDGPETKKIKIKIDPEDEDSDELEVKAFLFEDGPAEDWVKWRMQLEELIRDIPLQDGTAKMKTAKALLKGEARERFQIISLDLEIALDPTNPEAKEEMFSEAIERLGRRYFDSDYAYRRQRNYLRYHVFMLDMNYKEFKEELLRQNTYLRYFPIPPDRETCEPFDDDELVEIVDRAKRIEWQRDLLTANLDPYSMTLDEYSQYLEKLEVKYNMDKEMRREFDKKRKHQDGDNGDKNSAKKKPKKPDHSKQKGNGNKRDKACAHCNKFHPAPDDQCWSLEKNKPKKRGYNGNNSSTERMFSAAQVERLLNKVKKKGKSKRESKKQISFALDSDNNSTSDSDSDYSYLTKSTTQNEVSFAIRRNFQGNTANTKIKNSATAEIIVETTSKNGRTWVIRGLLDTGTTRSIILSKYVPIAQIQKDRGTTTKWTTMAGEMTTTKKANIEFRLPELSNSKTITWSCHVDETTKAINTPYDIILGLDFMTELGLVVDFSTRTIKWDESIMEMKPRGSLDNKETLELLYSMTQEPTVLQKAEERQNRILDADYSKVELKDYTDSLDYMSKSEQEKLREVLSQFPTLFGGGLGRLKIDPIHLELKEGAKPYHAKPFGIPKAYESTTKKEIERFEKLGIWKRVRENAWTAGTFIQPKKTGDVRVLTDFRKLNEYIVRRPHPLPKINDLLQKLEGFKYATAIDLSMGYYHIPLDDYSQKLCGTAVPWGLYQYTVLPMGICNAPDIFQSIMMRLLGDLEHVHCYIDDILITSCDSYEDHLEKVRNVLNRLEKAGFRANVRKCTFAADRVEYLGYDISRRGIHPQPKKVEAILKMQAPTTKRQLRRFLGMVNYYRDMWKRRSHILAPLTALCGKTVTWKWTKECTEAFESIKRSMARETLLNFPDFNKEFHIYTDASDYQLGAVIMQDDKPLAFYSRKLNKAQKNYTTGEQELLSIVETLKEFRNILIGQRLIVHTDHLNLLYNKMPSPRVIRWRLLLEEYGAKFVHVAGEDNVVADTMSRHPNTDEEPTDKGEAGKQLAYCMNGVQRSMDEREITCADLVTEKDLIEGFPLSPKVIDEYQRKDRELLKKVRNDPTYNTVELEGTTLIAKEGKVVVPTALQGPLLNEYHSLLQHPGMTRMEATIRHVFYFRGLREKVEEHCRTCHVCQLNKKQRKKYGHLPPKEAEDCIPWKRVNVDMIGPYTVKTPTKTYELRAMTMIDPATSWFEVAPLTEPTSYETQKAFDSYWLARYPRPQEVGLDNGTEFKRYFRDLIENYGLKKKPSTEYNPQSNGIIERVHQVLGNVIRTFELENRELDDSNPWDEFLSAAAFAIRSTHHTTLEASPAQLVFGRDMLLPVKFVADWARIRTSKQKRIDESNKQENSRRIAHEYRVGDRVLLTTPGLQSKVKAPRTGPYNVVNVHNNGTVTLRKGHVQQRVNIRRISPYWTRD
jgi:hypothetical protein